jgi:nucleoside-diphosphate-sugar epimerase
MSESESEPNRLPVVLVLGGCGFVGRNLVHFLVQQNLASHIKVADKSMPLMSYFHNQFMSIFDNPIVEYQQADLTKYASFDPFIIRCDCIYDVDLTMSRKPSQHPKQSKILNLISYLI